MEDSNLHNDQKPIVEEFVVPGEDIMVDGRRRMPMTRFRARNLPELEEGAVKRELGCYRPCLFSLACSSCGHIIPRGTKLLGYFDIFRIFPGVGLNGLKKKRHLLCPKCSSEIVLEDKEIISGATEVERFRGRPLQRINGRIVLHPPPENVHYMVHLPAEHDEGASGCNHP